MKRHTLATLNILEPGSHKPHGLPLLRLGFRPFYLCAALLAIGNVGVWAIVSLGWLDWRPALPALYWHAHEMLFGFAAAVIVGFLLTAGKNWTGRQTPRGRALGALVLLWLAARLAALCGPPWLFALLDVALLPLIAGVLLHILRAAGNQRNLPIVAILGLLCLANAGFHLAAAGVLPIAPLQALHAALALVVMLEMVMAGRVIPGFTESALPRVKIGRIAALERGALGAGALGLLLWVLEIPGTAMASASGVVLLLAAVLHALRAARWKAWQVRGNPMLWILHAAYAWIVAGLLLLALAQWGWVASTLAVHALAVGATGALILGMMTRTARGHTGRMQRASRHEVLAFACVLLSALARVGLPLVWPALHDVAVAAAALLWCLAFGLFLVQYTPWLMQGRIDGSDG